MMSASLAKPTFPFVQRGRALSRGLAAAWPAYETSGNILHDVSGNRFHAAALAAGAAAEGSWAGGRDGSAISLNSASSQYFTFTLPRPLTSVEWTLSCWINSAANQTSHAGLVYFIGTDGLSISMGRSGTPNQLGWQWGGSEYLWDSGLIVPNNEWTLCALVVNAAGGTIYMGTPGALSQATDAEAVSAHTESGTLGIGAANNGSYFNGRMSDMRLWTRALSAGEIAQICAGQG